MLEECEICGQSTGKLYKCRICGARFCRYCGSFTDRICIDCIEKHGAEVYDAPEAARPGSMGEAMSEEKIHELHRRLSEKLIEEAHAFKNKLGASVSMRLS